MMKFNLQLIYLLMANPSLLCSVRDLYAVLFENFFPSSHSSPFLLGSDLQLLPKAYVLVDNCIISDDQVSLPKALKALLMSHFVFKIQYGSKAAPLLHFIQRYHNCKHFYKNMNLYS